MNLSVFLKLWIKDKESQEIIELNKKENIEIRWERGLGKGGKEVIFRKDGKNYRILVLVVLKNYLLGTRNAIVKDKFLAPPNSPYEIYKGYMGEPNNSPEKDRERQGEGVTLVNEWNWGYITIYLILIIVIAIFSLWIFKRKSRRIPNSY